METQLTPEEQAQISLLDRQIVLTPTVKKLQQMDAEIISDLEGLKIGQTSLEEKVDSGFAKGKERMDGIEGKVDKLQEMIAKSDIERDRQHGELKSEIRDDKLRELTRKLEIAEKQNEKNDGRAWDIIKIVLGVIIVAGLGYIGIK